MSVYDGIEEVADSKRSQNETVWIQPGKFELEVVRVKDGRADQGEGRPYFVAEFEVMSSTNPDIEVGTVVSWMTMRGKFKQYFLQDVKNFISAVMKCAPSQVSPEAVAECTGENQPLVGMVVLADAYNQVSKTSGKEFTVVNYKPQR